MGAAELNDNRPQNTAYVIVQDINLDTYKTVELYLYSFEKIVCLTSPRRYLSNLECFPVNH